MPRDIALLKKIPVNATAAFKKAAGKTDFVFEVFNNDMQFGVAKQITMTEGANKLVQGILKILLTKLGENIEDSAYGANVDVGIGNKLAQEEYADLRSGIIDALAHYNLLNMDNENPDEIIGNVDNVNVSRDTTDPRVILIYLSVTTQSGKKVNIMAPQTV